MPRNIRRKKIVVPYGTLSRIAEAFGCQIRTVRKALAFETNSEQAELIRTKAIKEYGGLMQHSVVVVVPRNRT